MSKIIGTEIRVGHAQRLSKLITTWLEINEKSFTKRPTVKFYEHLFSSSWVAIFSQTDGQTKTWMGDSLGYETRKKSRRRTKDEYFGQCLWNFILNNSTNLQRTQYYGCGPGSVVGIATGYGLDGPGIESRWAARFSAPVQTGPGAHPASCKMGTGSYPG